MARTYIEDLQKLPAGEEVTIRGWLTHKRSSGKVRFLVVRDGSGLLQCVMVKGMVPDASFEAFDALTQEQIDASHPKHVSPPIVWIASAESKDFTGRIVEAGGGLLAISEGWHRGPTAAPTGSC